MCIWVPSRWLYAAEVPIYTLLLARQPFILLETCKITIFMPESFKLTIRSARISKDHYFFQVLPSAEKQHTTSYQQHPSSSTCGEIAEILLDYLLSGVVCEALIVPRR